jgi:hypothetical protein
MTTRTQGPGERQDEGIMAADDDDLAVLVRVVDEENDQLRPMLERIVGEENERTRTALATND